MSAMSDYLENKLTDLLFRGQAFSPPATLYFALFKLTAGQSPRSTAVTSGQTTMPATPNGRMYRCTTAGTTGAGEPSWSTTDGGTTSDGTAVWTEMTPDLDANNANITGVEVTGGSYARASLATSLANWSGTQGAGTTTASSGTGGASSNNGAIAFPAPTANWGVCGAMGIYDAASGGNQLFLRPLGTPKTVNNGDPAPSFTAGQLSTTFA